MRTLARNVAIILPILMLSTAWIIWKGKHSSLPPSQANIAQEKGIEGSHSPSSLNLNTANTANTVNPTGITNTSNSMGQSDEGFRSAATPNTTLVNSAPKAAEAHDACFSLNFKHKALASHSSDDECSRHRNVIKLGHVDANPSTLCIRVNGTPVRHETVIGKNDEFMIGAVAGPKDVITARFCVGKARCHESCPYPKVEAAKKDEFLEAIGGGSDDDTNVATAHWEAGDVAKNQEVNQALDHEIRSELEDPSNGVQRTAASNNRLEIFKEWMSENETTACGPNQAATRSVASVRQ